eukprot:gene30259-35246_t
MNSKIEANLRHIARHEAKPNPKPQSSTSVTRGFEAVAYPKIVKELGSDNLVVRQKSLLAARELLASPVSYMGCIAAGITPAVIKLLEDADALVRERAAGTLEFIATKEVGARDIKQHGGVALLVGLLQDSVTAVRDAAYRALIEDARFEVTRGEIVQLGTALDLLMKLVLEESQERSLQGLRLLNACVKMRQNQPALEQLVVGSGAIPSAVGLTAADKSPAIQEQAASLLSMLTSHAEEAKKEAVEAGCVPNLLAILAAGPSAISVTLATAVATALMAATIVIEGKYAAVKYEGGMAIVVKWLDPARSEQLCVNMMEVISNCAEAPQARPLLAEAGGREKLTEIREAAVLESLLERSAAQALRQCKFKSLPHQPLPGRTVVDDGSEDGDAGN